jgi:deoxycytidine triphosphate deaminase
MKDHLSDLRAEAPGGRKGLALALQVIEAYPGWVEAFVDKQVERHDGDPEAQRTVLQIALEQLLIKADFIETWFGQRRSPSLPMSLFDAVEEACVSLKVGPRRAVLAIGSPGNFETSPDNLYEYLFTSLGVYSPDPPGGLPENPFAMMLVPRLEGGEAIWRPLVLGHEIAHLALIANDSLMRFGLAQNFEWDRFDKVKLPGNRSEFINRGRDWVKELICDAYTVWKYGPAGVAAMAEFLEVAGATHEVSPTHPPGLLRTRLMLKWLGEPTLPAIKSMLEPWTQLASTDFEPLEEWVKPLLEMLESFHAKFLDVIAGWELPRYDYEGRAAVVEAISEDLDSGIPAADVYQLEKDEILVADEDTINAGWQLLARGTNWPIGRLVSKSVDSLAFLSRWRQFGSLDIGKIAPPPKTAPTGVLSDAAILNRISRPETSEERLVVRPLLPYSRGPSALDVRLGNQFIVFHRAGWPVFRTLARPGEPESLAPRSAQRRVDVGWGEIFVLHPDELILASTLEYVALPADLSAQVITRSSYGRLGLITATAIQVHPFFRGCLTLELVNLGRVPLELTPGERIAQLVFISVSPPAVQEEPNFDCPVAPEFYRARQYDDEAAILHKIGRTYTE